VKHKQLLAMFLSAAALFSSSCGVSDSVKSLTISSKGSTASVFNLVGQDGTIQLVVNANYHSGKTVEVTNDSTFSVTPVGTIFTSADPNFQAGGPLPPYGPTTVPINKTGVMTGIVSICTWQDLIDNTKNPPVPFSPPQWAYTGFYQVTASYKGFTSQPIAIGVGAAESNAPGCGPS
jgi:hypothetical protein